ncbi:hypothetical protein DSUL_20142 [Desulfovibrionales bacterium]
MRIVKIAMASRAMARSGFGQTVLCGVIVPNAGGDFYGWHCFFDRKVLSATIVGQKIGVIFCNA